jgi:Protein of unknown function (DUF938)
MSAPRNLPSAASFAEDHGGGRLFAPSAARNIEPIADVLAHHAPEQGSALEIASGTGQHVAVLAERLPNLVWQPTDIDAARLASINAWASNSSTPNILPSVALNATQEGWSARYTGQSLITLTNLLHLISEKEARTLIREAGQALALQGILHIYGPFLRDGETTSEGDAEFNTKLRAADPDIGYKDDWDVIDWIHTAGMDLVQVIEMPSNNISFVAKRVF